MSDAVSESVRPEYVGNDKALFGIVFGVLAFWLFAQTTLNIAPLMGEELGVQTTVMNIAVSITALFSGIFIVVVGGLADRLGRVMVLNWGFVLSIAGSLIVGLAPAGALAEASLMIGRILQGLSAAAIMSSSLALVKTYWHGAARQRAISLWSIGSWGGSGFAALFGGLMADNVGWRWIFFGSALLSLIGMLMVRGMPESRVASRAGRGFDLPGVIYFMVLMVALQVYATQGSALGWLSPASLALIGITLVFGYLFFRQESGNPDAFVDFKLFRNMTFTGATVSNFLLNGTAGLLIVAMTLVQLGGEMSAQDAGMLTLGYALTIVLFIRVGEKLLQKFGPRLPMIWGSLIVGAAILCLMPTHLLIETYKVLAVIGFALFGLGLAFYATPSTDAALSNLPEDQAGSGAGIYKMASSLGASFGVAICAAVFTAVAAGSEPVPFVDGIISLVGRSEFLGRTDNVVIRQAGFIALALNLVMAAAAVVSIMLTIPRGKKVESHD